MRRLGLLLVVACSGSGSMPPTGPEPIPDGPQPPPAAAGYEATIRWTEHGVPHIVAKDLGSVAFGQGSAFASTQGCLLAERVLTVRSQRARYLGPGENGRNIDSDFAYLTLGVMERATAALPDLSEESRAVAAGFAAGYNHRLAGHGFAGFCRGAAWVTPITAVGVRAHGLDASILASSRAFAPRIGSARPHTAGESKAPGATGALPDLRDTGMASNGWAVGAERSASGHGLLVANPHFPWVGPLTFYESHLTVPGQLDAYGASLMGVPLMVVGFNQGMAWTSTFSDAVRFTIYRLTLDPADPTRYRYGDETRAMTSRRFTVQVKQPDGSLKPVERTLWRSHHGPMLDGDQLAWDAAAGQAFAIRDAAFESPRGLDQYLAILRARDVTELRAALATHQTTPYVNVIATDRSGTVFYADGSRVPNLSPAALAAWKLARRTMPPVQQAWESGIVALDGSMRLFDWVDAPGAPAPGVIPFTAAPQLTRRDFVFNANDSAWLPNPAQPLTAQSPLYGDIEAPQSPRTRMNLKLLTETGPQAASGADGRFDLDELERTFTGNRVFTAELMLDDVLAACRAGKGKRSRPCEVLAAWDRRVDLDSAGALLWRELVASFPRGDYYKGTMFATPFDPRRPLETPAKLRADLVMKHLDQAAAVLKQAGIDPGARPGDHVFTEIGGNRIPVHGGPENLGTTNQHMYQPQSTMARDLDPGAPINPASGLTARGYPVNYGTSFLMLVELAEGGPRARGLMTYGSPEQMQMWSRKQLRPMRFADADIQADPALRVERVQAPR